MANIFRRKRTWLIVLLVVIATPIVAFKIMEASFEISPKEMVDYFKDKPQQPRFVSYTALNHQMFYAETGSDTNQLVLFVHGAPGTWDNYMKYLGDTALMHRGHLVAVDRPGFGKSGYGKSVTSIEEQAAMIRPILDSNKCGKPAILIGHSLGGPVIARIAMDYPDKVGGPGFSRTSN
jgi:pimeloyl-ACP methyl ester carboxylesterase